MVSINASKVVPNNKSPTPPLPKIRIYVVDDHPLIRKALSSLLASEPDMVICGESGSSEAAFNEITKLMPDIVLVDLSLHGNSGLELIKTIRALDPGIGVVVVSMHHEDVYGLRSLRAGARGYVMKQEAPDKIVSAIREIRSGRVFASSDLTNQVLGRIRGGEDPSASPISELSDRELEVAELIGRGNTTNEIAARLHVSIKTVETHRTHIKEKLHLDNATQVIHFCARWIQEKDSPAMTGVPGM